MYKAVLVVCLLCVCMASAQKVIDVSKYPTHMSKKGGEWFVFFTWIDEYTYGSKLFVEMEKLAFAEPLKNIAICDLQETFCKNYSGYAYYNFKLLFFDENYPNSPSGLEYGQNNDDSVESFRSFLRQHRVRNNAPPQAVCIKTHNVLKEFFINYEDSCTLVYGAPAKANITCVFENALETLDDVLCDHVLLTSEQFLIKNLYALRAKLNEISNYYQSRILLEQFTAGVIKLELSNFPTTALLCYP